MNMFQCGSSDRFLLGRLQIHLIHERDVESTSVRKNSTSIRPLQEPLLLQVAQILPDRHLTNCETIGEVLNLDGSCFLQQMEDLTPSRFRIHSRSVHVCLLGSNRNGNRIPIPIRRHPIVFRVVHGRDTSNITGQKIQIVSVGARSLDHRMVAFVN